MLSNLHASWKLPVLVTRCHNFGLVLLFEATDCSDIKQTQINTALKVNSESTFVLCRWTSIPLPSVRLTTFSKPISQEASSRTRLPRKRVGLVVVGRPSPSLLVARIIESKLSVPAWNGVNIFAIHSFFVCYQKCDHHSFVVDDVFKLPGN